MATAVPSATCLWPVQWSTNHSELLLATRIGRPIEEINWSPLLPVSKHRPLYTPRNSLATSSDRSIFCLLRQRSYTPLNAKHVDSIHGWCRAFADGLAIPSSAINPVHSRSLFFIVVSKLFLRIPWFGHLLLHAILLDWIEFARCRFVEIRIQASDYC